MSVLWALVALLSIHTGGLNGVSGQVLPSIKTPSLPSDLTSLIPATNLLSSPNLQSVQRSLPAPVPPVPRIPPPPKKKPQKDPSETPGQHCEPSAWYSVSKKNVDNYLNDTLPEAIKNVVHCAEYDLTGIIKTALETADLESLLGVVSSLGLGGNGNLLSSLTGSLPVGLPGLSTDGLPGIGGLTDLGSLPGVGGLPGLSGSGGLGLPSSLLKNGNPLSSTSKGAKNILGQGGNPLELSKPGNLVNSALKTVKDSEESQGLDKSEDLIKKAGSVVPNDISGVSLGATKEGLANIDPLLESLDLKLHVSDIIIKNLTTISEGNSINVEAYVEADISGTDDLVGSVTDLMGFRMDAIVHVTIAPNMNGAKCVIFKIIEKGMEVKKINIKIIDRVNKEVKGLVPLPLDSLIPSLLMVNATSPEGECNLALKNPACKNETTATQIEDLFQYHVKTGTFTPKGLQMSYCAEINYKGKLIPVDGGPSPQLPKDAEASLALSSSMVKALVTAVAKESSVKSKDAELKVKTMSYKLGKNRILLDILADIKENGFHSASLDTVAEYSHNTVLYNSYLISNFFLLSSEHKVDPADNEAAKEMGKQMIMKVTSTTNEYLRHLNVPVGPEVELLNAALVQVGPQGDLILSK